MKLEKIHYFAECYFFSGMLWSEFDELYKEFRRSPIEFRHQFKNEVLYVNQLFNEKNFETIDLVIKESNLSDTRIHNIEFLHRFVNVILPLIEKYDYKPEIIYEPFKVFQYMLENYIIPSDGFPYIFESELQEEGDTYVSHLLKDVEAIQELFTKNDRSKIEHISSSSGVYILNTANGERFLKHLKDNLS